MIQALSSDTQEKAFTDGIGAFRVIRCFAYIDATCCCHASATGSKLAIIIANEIPGGLSIGSCLPQLLRGPSVGRRSRHADMDDFPRFQLDDEERKERTDKEISDLEEITCPDFSGMIAEESRPVLPS